MFGFPRRNTILHQRAKGINDKRELMASCGAEVALAGCAVQRMLLDRSWCGCSYGMPLTSDEAARLDAFVPVATWAVVLQDMVATRKEFGALPSIFELSCSAEIVSCLGWDVLLQLLQRLGSLGSLAMTPAIALLLRRQLLILLAALDDKRTVEVPPAFQQVTECVVLLYAAIGGDNQGDVLSAPHLNADCAGLTKHSRPIVRIVDWLVHEKRWRALSVCATRLTARRWLPKLALLHPVLQSPLAAAKLELDAASIAIAQLRAMLPPHKADDGPQDPQLPASSIILKGNVPLDKVAICHSLLAPIHSVLETVWDALLESPDGAERMIAQLSGNVCVPMLQLRSPCTGNTLIHHVALRGNHVVLRLVVQKDPSSVFLLSCAPLREVASRGARAVPTNPYTGRICWRVGHLPLYVALRRAPHQGDTNVHDVRMLQSLQCLLSREAVIGYCDPNVVPLEALMEVFDVCFAQGHTLILQRLFSHMTSAQFASHFRALAQLAAASKHPSTIDLLFDDCAAQLPAEATLAWIVTAPVGDRSAVRIAAALGNMHALEALKRFSSAATSSGNDEDLAAECVTAVFNEYFRSGLGDELGPEEAFAMSRLYKRNCAGTTEQVESMLLSSRVVHQERLVMVVPLVLDIVGDHLRGLRGMTVLRLLWIRLRSTCAGGPDAPWLAEFLERAPLLRKAVDLNHEYFALCDSEDVAIQYTTPLERLIQRCACYISRNSPEHGERVMAMMVDDYLLASNAENNVWLLERLLALAKRQGGDAAARGWLRLMETSRHSSNVGENTFTQTVAVLASLLASPLVSACFPPGTCSAASWMPYLAHRVDHAMPCHRGVFSSVHASPRGCHDTPLHLRARVDWLIAAHRVYTRDARGDLGATIDLLLRLPDATPICDAVVQMLLGEEADEVPTQVQRAFTAALAVVASPETNPSFPRRLENLNVLLRRLSDVAPLGHMLFCDCPSAFSVLSLLCTAEGSLGWDCNRHLAWNEAIEAVAKMVIADLDAMFPRGVSAAHSSVNTVIQLQGTLTSPRWNSKCVVYDKFTKLITQLAASACSVERFRDRAHRGTCVAVRAIGRDLIQVLSRSIVWVACLAPPGSTLFDPLLLVHFTALGIASHWQVVANGDASPPPWLSSVFAHASRNDWRNHQPDAAQVVERDKKRDSNEDTNRDSNENSDEDSNNEMMSHGKSFSAAVWGALLRLRFDSARAKPYMQGSFEDTQLEMLLNVLPPLKKSWDAKWHWTPCGRCVPFSFQRRFGRSSAAPPINPSRAALAVSLTDQWVRYARTAGAPQPHEPITDAELQDCLLRAFGWLANSADVMHSTPRFLAFLSGVYQSLPQSSHTRLIGALLAGVEAFKLPHIPEAVLAWVQTLSGPLPFDVSAAKSFAELQFCGDESCEDEGDAGVESWCTQPRTALWLVSSMRYLAARQRLLKSFGVWDLSHQQVDRWTTSPKALWCALSISARFQGRYLSTAAPPMVQVQSRDDPVAQLLLACPSLAVLLGRSVVSATHSASTWPIRWLVLGNDAVAECLWGPFFASVSSEDLSDYLRTMTLSTCVQRCLFEELERRNCTTDDINPAARLKELQHLSRTGHAPRLHESIFADEVGETLDVAQLRGRLSSSQVQLWATEPPTVPLTHVQCLTEQLSLELPEAWTLSVEISNGIGHQLTSSLIGRLALPAAVLQELQLYSDTWRRWEQLDLRRFKVFLEEYSVQEAQEASMRTLIDFFSSVVPAAPPAGAEPSRRSSPALTLHVVLSSEDAPWTMTLSAQDGSSEVPRLVLNLPLTASMWDGTIVGSLVTERGFSAYRPDDSATQPRVVLVPLAPLEEQRVISEGNAYALLLHSYMDAAFGTITPKPKDALRLTQRPVDDVIRDMLDAGLPEVTLGLLQAILDRYYNTGTQREGGTTSVSHQLSRQVSTTSLEDDDLLCCVCLSNSLLQKPVMLSCFHLICEACVKSLSAHRSHKCPICNALTMSSPKIQVVLPEPPSTTKPANASAPPGIVDAFVDAPSVVAALCRLILKDVEGMGLPTSDARQRARWHWTAHDDGGKPLEVRIFASACLESSLKQHLATVLHHIRHVANIRVSKAAELKDGMYGRTALMCRRGNIGIIMNYLVGPQALGSNASSLAHRPVPLAPFCVQTWTWIGSTLSAPLAADTHTLNAESIQRLAANYGVARLPRVALSTETDAATREDRMLWD